MTDVPDLTRGGFAGFLAGPRTAAAWWTPPTSGRCCSALHAVLVEIYDDRVVSQAARDRIAELLCTCRDVDDAGSLVCGPDEVGIVVCEVLAGELGEDGSYLYEFHDGQPNDDYPGVEAIDAYMDKCAALIGWTGRK